MWSSDRLRFRKRAIPGVVALLLGLGGCFQPMYGGLQGGRLAEEMRAIYVEPVRDRLGHYLTNELIFALNGTGSNPAAKYRLAVTVTERVQSPVIDTISGRATAGTVVVDANYRLLLAGTEKVVTEGTAFAASSYDRTSQRFANIRAARDAQIRTAKTLADQIRTRIAIALSQAN